MTRPRVTLLRGHHANVWDLRPWERLTADYDVSFLLTGSNVHQVAGLGLEAVPTRTPRDLLPAGRAAGAAAYAVGERYLGLAERLAGADIVHAAEIGTWFSAQAARLRRKLGFRLVVTVWETIPWRDAYRWPRERGYRRDVLGAADLFLATTERARNSLLLEGADPDRVVVAPPGIDLDRFAPAEPPSDPGDEHLVLSAGRLVWEKGHQDVLRAVAALRRGVTGRARDARMLVVGDGPERKRLEQHAAELGLDGAVEFRATVPYDEMPALYARASCLVLASLPVRGWEEQFGMVLVEAMAAGTPVVACATGAIPEVVGDDGELVNPGDWAGIARALDAGPLSRPAGTRRPVPERLSAFSTEAAAQRLQDAYRRVLS